MVNGKYDVQTLELPPQEEGEDGGGAGEMEEVEGEREREFPMCRMLERGRKRVGGLTESRAREAATGNVPESLAAAGGARGVASGCACECAEEDGGVGCG